MDNQIINKDPVSTPVNPPTDEPVKQSVENVRYAGFLRRYVAYVFDWQLLLFIILSISYSLPSFVKNHAYIIGWSFSLLFIAYKILTVKIYGKTIGKSIFGLRVVGINSEKISWLQVIIREFVSFFISMPFLIGELFYFFTSKKQTLHDKLAHVVVIRENPLSFFKKILAFIIVFVVPSIVAVFIIFMQNKQFDNTNKRNDLIESITQYTQVMIKVKELCQSLPSFQTPQIICVMNNDSNCLLSKMSLNELEDLSKQQEKAIMDCVDRQTELERQAK